MKYLEELSPGNYFELSQDMFIVTCDKDTKNNRLCINLISGNPRWINNTSIVSIINLYTLDENSNIIPLNSSKSNV